MRKATQKKIDFGRGHSDGLNGIEMWDTLELATEYWRGYAQGHKARRDRMGVHQAAYDKRVEERVRYDEKPGEQKAKEDAWFAKGHEDGLSGDYDQSLIFNTSYQAGHSQGMAEWKNEQLKPKTYTILVSNALADLQYGITPFNHVEANEVKVNATGGLEFYTDGKLTHARVAGEWLRVTLGDFGKIVFKKEDAE